jgi:predicted nucleic acid-binding Zn ribbon protein
MAIYIGQCLNEECVDEEGNPTTFEYRQPIDDRANSGECPRCGGATKHIINGVGAVKLYGVGLYKRTLRDTGDFA